MRLFLAMVIGLGVASCAKQKAEFKTGIWRGVIELQGQQLPFNFEVIKDTSYKVYLKNAGERLLLDEVTLSGDTVNMVLHIFDAELRAKINGDELSGYYVKNFEKDYRLPFHAKFGKAFRFEKVSKEASVDFSGKYAVRFIHDKDTAISVGVFSQHGNHIEGTFLNQDGDYRYLEGSVVNGKMWLSTFDGHHAYLFSATRHDKILSGDYWSGKGRHETWIGTADENAALPDLESLTYFQLHGRNQIPHTMVQAKRQPGC